MRQHCSDLRTSMERFQADHDSDLRQLCVERWAARPATVHDRTTAQSSLQRCEQTTTPQIARATHMHCAWRLALIDLSIMEVNVAPYVMQQHATAAAAAAAGHCTALAEDGRSAQRPGTSACAYRSIKTARHVLLH